MKDFVKRMIEEHKELNERLIKLKRFINNGHLHDLDDRRQELLMAQYHAMETYDYILCLRIETEEADDDRED